MSQRAIEKNKRELRAKVIKRAVKMIDVGDLGRDDVVEVGVTHKDGFKKGAAAARAEKKSTIFDIGTK
jgi:hypothetical protein